MKGRMRGAGSHEDYGRDELGGVLGVGFREEMEGLYWVLECLAL